MSTGNPTTPYIKDGLLPSDGQTKYNGQGAKQDLEFLNAKLTAVTRDVSVYDFYNITTIIQDINEYNIKINNLLPGQSAIIGAEHLTTPDASLRRGDIVFKMQDYSLQIVRGVRGGVFYPSKIKQPDENVANYILTFTNTPVTPEDGTTTITVGEEESLSEPRKNIEISGLQTSQPGNYYNRIIQVNNDSISFPNITDSMPVIKGYNNNHEEIYGEYILTLINGNYIISGIPSCVDIAVIK